MEMRPIRWRLRSLKDTLNNGLVFSLKFSWGEKGAKERINHVASALGNRPRDGDLFWFIRRRGCGAFRM